MKARTSLRVVVVGAGIGGLGTAIALSQAGHDVIVLEQAQEFVEVGVLASPNTRYLNEELTEVR
jgi:salicylate hydroxylase